MSLKKVFPVIIVLVTLSLIGIIYIQYNWLETLLENQQEEFKMKVNKTMRDVSLELMEPKPTLPSLKSFRSRPGFNFPSDQFQFELIKPPTIAQKFTEFEIAEKLAASLASQGLKDIRFEFAITGDINSFIVDYELKSPGFLQAAADTVNNFQWQYPLQPAAGSDYESLMPVQIFILVVPDIKKIVLQNMRWMIVGSAVFTLLIICAFYITVHALLRQKKLSEIKNDFINNMTHELKTPLATISLAVDALRNEKVLSDKSKMEYFSGIIKEENKRMNKHVETILQAALSERQEIKLNKKSIAVQPMIEQVLTNYTLQLEEKKGRVELKFNAKNDVIFADEVHLRNLISNLIDNAVKYSDKDLILKVCTNSNSKNFILKVEDNGIGMNKETQKRIFEKFYRAHTGNIHNVKGFGLGLSYVKTVVDAHEGKIKVDSTLGKGSTFTIELPLYKA